MQRNKFIKNRSLFLNKLMRKSVIVLSILDKTKSYEYT